MKTNKISGIARTLIRGLMCLPLLALPSAAQNVSRLLLEESSNLQSWQPVPVTPAMLDANGEILVPTDTPEKFYRMKLELLMPPGFTAQPASVSIASGQTTTLNAAASGTGPFTYQWYQGSVGTTTTPVGTNSASFTTPALTATTDYWVKVTNALGTVNSSAATVTVTSGVASSRAVEFSAATREVTNRLAAPGWVKPSDGTETLNSSAVVVPTDMALIPAGAFTMGRTSGDTDADAPPVTVTVSEFYMGKYEVTKALWDEVRTYGAANGYTDLSEGAVKGSQNIDFVEGDHSDNPVHTISWFDMVKWCNARSQQDGLTPVYTVNGATMKTGTSEPTADWSANGYRLPTEAEWEKAARGGVDGKRFPWGTDTISHSEANYFASSFYSYDVSNAHPDGMFHQVYSGELAPYTSPVGSFAANEYGLYDMAGNVSEWCWDWYEESSYVSGATDPRGATSGTVRVFRGGSWYTYPAGCRVANRHDEDPEKLVKKGLVGFRVARSFTGPEQANTAPTISDIAAQSINADSNTGALAFTVGDAQTEASFLTLSASSSNASLVPNASIVFGGSGASRMVTVTPAMGQSGTATITVTVSDGSLSTSDTFLLKVANTPAAPTGFSLIPSGSFIMGDAVDGDSANPTRTVDVSAFYMAKNLTTMAEWDTVRAWAISNGYTDLIVGLGNASDHPVLMPSWYQAVKFCNARSQQEGLTPVYYTDEAQTTVYKTGNAVLTGGMVKWTANGYRLPTEAEWEKAARGGLSGKRYPWGDTISQTQASYDPFASDNFVAFASSAWWTAPLPNTSPVGSFAANGYGLNDMAGNVMQWCWDEVKVTEYFAFNENYKRMARGGSGVRNESFCRVAKQYPGLSDGVYHGWPTIPLNADFGFRVARSSVPY
ncbi:MAG: SUMF1/EgtB/PvdO family nonheme iron enzyme [Akkermansiaceae bacterium]|nr:SUMF1/EgtB/PvdO family nonheme iron enzyme [Akkermansiaceae bacterium]